MVCIYADGLFYKKLKYPEAINVKNIVDERPSSGVGSSAVTFREHFTFEDGFKIQLREKTWSTLFQKTGHRSILAQMVNVCVGLLHPFTSKTSKA